MSPEQRQEILSIFNHPATRLSGPSLLHDLVSKGADDGLPAIEYRSAGGGRSSLSYRSFHELSESIARRISAAIGIRTSNDPFIVPVFIPQCPVLYASLLAILKAGGAFCPLSVDTPPERARFILGDVSAKVVLTTTELATKFVNDIGDLVILLVDLINVGLDSSSPASVYHRQPAPSDLAYVMYTSGSTGTPKGVGISHEAATQSLLAHDRHMPPFSRFLQFAAPTFDVSVFEIFFPLFKGRTLVSCNRSDILNDLPSVLREMDVDACELTPTVAGSLLRARDSAPCLRLLLTIGEMLARPVVEEFGGSEGCESMLWAMYGPTEAAIHCTLQPSFAKTSVIGSIGIPFDTVSAFVLKIPEAGETDDGAKFQILPRGEVGELAVGGYQLAQGYLNRPEQTAAVFIDTPYGRLYRTGDKARLGPDGTFECLGRISDGQVKLRGQRIELGEVEHAALRTPGCHGSFAAVIQGILVLFCAVDESSGNTRLDGLQGSGHGDIEAEIWRSCKAWLPGFMIPGDIVMMSKFPRLDSGKIDRKMMIATYSETRDQGLCNEVQYKDDLEKQLCHFVGEVLDIKVAPSQELSKAGMESLNSIRLASKIRQAGYEITAIDILTSKTVSVLHTRIASQQVQREDSHPDPSFNKGTSARKVLLPDIETVCGITLNRAIEKILPCTPLQASMLAETVSNPQAYCNWVEISFPQDHSDESIRSWVAEIAKKNEILRTGFVHHEESFAQIVFEGLEADQICVGKLAQARRDFEISSETQFLNPFMAHILRQETEVGPVLLLQMHHAIYDGWSKDMLLADLDTLSRGKQLAPRPQFCDIVSYFQSERFEKDCNDAREFWAGTLAGFERSQIPNWTVGIPQSPASRSKALHLDVSPRRAGDSLRNSVACEAPVLFQAAVTWLWSALTGNEDVVIGSVTSGRTLPIRGVEDITGPCISTVPLRTNLAQVRTVGDLLRSIHDSNRSLLPHSVLPLSDIKKAARVPPGQTLYDVLFVYQKSLYSRDGRPKEIREISHQDYLETKLVVEVEPKAKGFDCRITYHADSFSDAHVELMLQQLHNLVSAILKKPNYDLESLQKVFPDAALSHYNRHPKSFCGVPDLATAVEYTARQFPEKTALCFAHELSESSMQVENISFSELDALANRIAWRLRHLGVSPDSVVAIVMEKSVFLYAGILAILKAGCAYLPLLPSTPHARVQTIFDGARVSHALVDSATKGNLEGMPAACCLEDITKCDLKEFPDRPLGTKPDPSRVAYVIYTSGSTGVPKGVCVTQLNIVSNIDVLSRIYPVNHDSRLLQSCSQAFDVSVFEIFFSWTQGMCLCSAVNDVLLGDLELSIRKLEVTHLSLTPTVASLIHPDNIPSVEFLVTAGEAMTEAVANKWCKQLYQGYGPSETTNICSAKKMYPNELTQHLGWCFENTSTFVLFKDSMNLVPLGCFGELCFGGDQVAQGYLNHPELTSSKFLDHPEFGRIYRSGDLGRMLPDGSMIIAGRIDDQVKIRGQRIELKEITAVVRGSGEVSQSVTVLIQAGSSSESGRLVTFFIPCPVERTDQQHFDVLEIGHEVKSSITNLFHLLDSMLPAYMVPSHLIPISSLPTTTSGKLDTARLRAKFQTLPQNYLELVSPHIQDSGDDDQWSQQEREVADAVASVFNTYDGTAGKWTPLTILGLDSISAIRVSKALQAIFGRRVPVSTILKNPTVARLARALDANDSVLLRPSQTLPLLPESFMKELHNMAKEQGKAIEKVLPCTPLQEGMLISRGGHGSYLNSMLFLLHDDAQKMKMYWTAICQRHAILRTCFVTTNDTRYPIAQVVLGGWTPPWLDINAGTETVQECISQQAAVLPEAIDSTSMNPVVSFALIRDNDTIHLSFLCHHALYDGRAIGRVLFEVEQLAAGNTIPPAPVFESFLEQALSLPESTDCFWKNQLGDFHPKALPRTKYASQGRSNVFALSTPYHLSQINEKVKKLGVSLLALCQSAWAVVLASLLKTEHVCFGNVVNGRSLLIDRLDELVAPCFNTVPVFASLANGKRNIDIMQALQNTNHDILEYQFTPLRRVQSLLSRKYSRNLFDTLLLLQQPSLPLNPVLWSIERDDGEMDFPLACEVTPDPQADRLIVKLHSQPGHYAEDALRSIFNMFIASLHPFLYFPASQMMRTPVPPELAMQLLELSPEDLEVQETEAGSGSGGYSDLAETWSETEESVRSVLASLSASNEQHIRRSTAIYQLGLDSISAVQIASLLRGRGFRISATDVIENPTCEGLAGHIEGVDASSTLDSNLVYDMIAFQDKAYPKAMAFGIPMDEVEAVLPCTPVQAAMLAQFIESGGRDYFNFIDYRSNNGLDASSLVEAWKSLCTIHSMFRTGFISTDLEGSPYTMVQYRPGSKLAPVSVVTGQQIVRFNTEKWRLDASHEAARSLHLPPWRVVCVDSGSGPLMHLAIHHALYDAHSLRILLSDLAKLHLGSNGVLHATRTEDAVSSILGQAGSWEINAKEFWKAQSNRTVINRFPTMTPLREETRQVLVEAFASGLGVSTLERATRKAGYTVQVVLQSAWARLLSSYLGESSVVFGVVLSGRTTEATRHAVFPCITTLPVISENVPSNTMLLQQMLKFNTELFKFQHTRLSNIQQWMGYPDTRLFDTLLVYQRHDGIATDMLPWTTVSDVATVDYPISIEIEHGTQDKLEYRVTFYSDVLPRQQARMLLKQFDRLVFHLALNPDGFEGDILPSQDHELVSVQPPDRSSLPSQEKFLHEFVETRAQTSPEKIALKFVDGFRGVGPVSRVWTYKQLDENGDRVATLLLPHVNVADIVAVCFDKSPEAFFAILGILKAGCSFVALDPGAPPSRKEFITRDSHASVLLMAKARAAEIDFAVSIPVIRIDLDSLVREPAKPVVLKRDLLPSDGCYCLYTSGTTGTPKGCEITHENAVQSLLAFQYIFKGHWNDDSRWLQFASFHFDVSVLEQYWSWSVGITLVAAPRDIILEDLAGMISRLKITHIDLTPSLACLLHPDDVPSLCRGVFITGGESLKPEILDVWGSRAVIYNFYGPTEATIGVTVYPRVPKNGRPSNIGKQFANVGSFVLKPGTETPVLRGGVGELCVSGRLVGKGYLGRDDLTAERFPTLRSFGQRVYRTGDLVRMLHDGCFDFLGRADDQVKLRGQRLEIGEINHTIRTGIADAHDVATLVIRNEKQQKDTLVSFLVTNARPDRSQELRLIDGPQAAALCQRVQSACRSKLPNYMVPTYVLLLSFIPLSSNNKAEVRELRKLFNSLSVDQLVSFSSSGIASSKKFTLTGEMIRNILALSQNVDPASILPSSSIFELGIDSISVLQFSRALKRRQLLNASPAVILRHHILWELADTLDKEASHASDSLPAARQLVQACHHRHMAHVCQELGVHRDQIDYIAPCSPLQQGMVSRCSTTYGAYFNTFRFELARNDVSVSQLREAWNQIVQAHSILRTVFIETIDGIVQAAVKDFEIPWIEVVAPSTEVEHLLRTKKNIWVESNRLHVRRPLELLLVRAAPESDDQKPILVLHIFHGLYDAISLRLLVDAVATAYVFLNNKSSEASNLVSVPSFLEALQHGPLTNLNSCKPFWVSHLRGASGLAVLPPPTSLGAHPAISMRDMTSTGVEQLRTSLGVTHQAIIQAAWVFVLGKHFNVNPTIGVILSGRSIDLEGIENTIGPLFNTLPFQAIVHSEPGRPRVTWESLVHFCHDYNTSVLPFQHVPLRDIQKWCSAGKPLFDTLFSLQWETEKPDHAKGLWTEKESGGIDPDYPLAMETTVTRNGLRLLLVARGGVADEQTLAILLNEFEVAISSMVQNIRSEVFEEAGIAVRAYDVQESNGTVQNDGTAHTGRQRTNSTQFVWTNTAALIRKEMAFLAGTTEEHITETTPLFELGLDSVDIIKLSARLRKTGIILGTALLMKQQTISACVDILEARASAVNSSVIADGKPTTESRCRDLRRHLTSSGVKLGEEDLALPPTPLQDGMIAEMISSGFRQYFNHDILEAGPHIDTNRLVRAWKTVVKQSPVLRTTFFPIDSPEFEFVYCQIVREEAAITVREVDLDSPEELVGLMKTARERACEGSGMRDLLQLNFATVRSRKFVVLSLAHALYDGWSLGLLHQDVDAAYNEQYTPRPSYAPYLQRIVESVSVDASNFWAGFLDNARPSMLLKTTGRGTDESLQDMKGPVNRAEAISSVSLEFARSFCRHQGVTMQVLGQACWASLIATRTKSLDVTFGVVLSGRDSDVAETLMFPTMNTVAVRSILHGTISEWLQYMQQNMANIAQHQNFPLRKAQRLSGAATGPLFNTLFTQQRQLPPSHADTDEPFMRSIDSSATVEYPVCVEMEVLDGALVWRTGCDSEYISIDDTSLLLHQLDTVLTYFLNYPDADVLAFSAQHVSICGLPSFIPKMLADKESHMSTWITDDDTESQSSSPLESHIMAVLSSISGMDIRTISRRQNVYHLGLDSISVVKASSMLRKQGIELGPRQLLNASTIAEMTRLAAAAASTHLNESAEDLNKMGQDASGEIIESLQVIDNVSLIKEIGIDQSIVEEIMPATAMQVHMLSTWQNSQGDIFYPEFRYRVSGVACLDTIVLAWKTLVDEVPILRTIFACTGTTEFPFLQLVLRSEALQYPDMLSATGWNSIYVDHEQHADAPFASISVRLEKTGTWLLCLKIHHALYDGVSLTLMKDRLRDICVGLHTERAAVEQAVWKWKYIISSQLTDTCRTTRKNFWTGYLSGARSTPFPPPCELSSGMDKRIFHIQDKAYRNISVLQSSCAAAGITVQALFFAAYARILASSLAGSDSGIGVEEPQDVVFGVYLASRDRSDRLEKLPYPTLALVPVRVRAGGRLHLLEIAARIQDDLRRISDPDHVGVGLWEIKDWTGVVIHSFVNFLSLANHEGQGGEDAVVGDNSVIIRDVTSERSSSWETPLPVRSNGPMLDSHWLKPSYSVREAYPLVIDIEITIRADGMNIGVFGPKSMLGDTGAEEIIKSITTELVAFLEK